MRWFRRRNKHVHEWEFLPRTASGWGVVRCLTCPREDIYS